ncbi:Hypothetical predicted protein [Olea europaea subsp. europaea]|uniref:Uncharacterized protein n=1 Tax=Olea europaea subsp. europaea TaxID=158383 RepID=A0A8S0PZ19_OLEEU|nr:Hypothetical predicted protein [Olea europaea subsp. europaea]
MPIKAARETKQEKFPSENARNVAERAFEEERASHSRSVINLTSTLEQAKKYWEALGEKNARIKNLGVKLASTEARLRGLSSEVVAASVITSLFCFRCDSI